jgi:hypothetical protein
VLAAQRSLALDTKQRTDSVRGFSLGLRHPRHYRLNQQVPSRSGHIALRIPGYTDVMTIRRDRVRRLAVEMVDMPCFPSCLLIAVTETPSGS